MTAATDVQFKIVPDSESALISQNRPSNQHEEGMQSVFIKNVTSSKLRHTALQFYGLPSVPAQDATVKWIQNHTSHVNEKSFVFLQVAEKCIGFQKFNSLPVNFKITVTASAYLKLLQFFGAKNDVFSEWKRIEKKMSLMLESMKSCSSEIKMVSPQQQQEQGKSGGEEQHSSFNFLGDGMCKLRKVIERYDDQHDLSLFVCAKSSSNSLPFICLTYSKASSDNDDDSAENQKETTNLPEGSIQIFSETMRYLATDGIPFYLKQLFLMPAAANNKVLGGEYFTEQQQQQLYHTPPPPPAAVVVENNVPFLQDPFESVVQQVTNAPTTLDQLCQDLFESDDDDDYNEKNTKKQNNENHFSDLHQYVQPLPPLISPLTPTQDEEESLHPPPLPYYKMPPLFTSVLGGSIPTPAATSSSSFNKKMQCHGNSSNNSKKPYNRNNKKEGKKVEEKNKMSSSIKSVYRNRAQ